MSEDKVPGLHKIGPAPWDYEFNPAEGMQVAAEVGGKLVTGIVTAFEEDEETGAVTLTVRPVDDNTPAARLEAMEYQVGTIITGLIRSEPGVEP